MYNSEEASFWTRNNILAAIQGALLASTAAIVGNADKALAPGASAAPAVLLFSALATLALVGLGMAVAWIYMVGRSERIADTMIAQLKRIEKHLHESAPVKLHDDFLALTKFGEDIAPGRSDGSAAPDGAESPPIADAPDARSSAAPDGADSPPSADTLGARSTVVEKPLTEKKWNNNVRLSVIWRNLGYALSLLWLILALAFVAMAFMLRPPLANVPSGVALLPGINHSGRHDPPEQQLRHSDPRQRQRLQREAASVRGGLCAASLPASPAAPHPPT
jgi:hypothetical protein